RRPRATAPSPRPRVHLPTRSVSGEGEGTRYARASRGAWSPPRAAHLEDEPVGQLGAPEPDVVARGTAQYDAGALVAAMSTGGVAVPARLTLVLHGRELGDEDLLEEPGDRVAVPIHGVLVHDQPPLGPKRSVLMLCGSCPSCTSRSATCSTNPVGPQTNTRSWPARSAPRSRSISAFTRPDHPLQPGGCRRVSVYRTVTPSSSSTASSSRYNTSSHARADTSTVASTVLITTARCRSIAMSGTSPEPPARSTRGPPSAVSHVK